MYRLTPKAGRLYNLNIGINFLQSNGDGYSIYHVPASKESVGFNPVLVTKVLDSSKGSSRPNRQTTVTVLLPNGDLVFLRESWGFWSAALTEVRSE